MQREKKISGGIYLIVDPSIDERKLLGKLEEAIQGNEIAAVQIWDNFLPSVNPESLVIKICDLCHKNNIPVLINNNWQLFKTTDADGVHLDEAPENLEKIKRELNRSCMMGITCNNDLSVVKWADENDLDYISFCSIFTSSTSNSCEIVNFDTIGRARNITSTPIFLAGGIRPENMKDLKGLDFEGIAVISGIMNSEDSNRATKEYQIKLKAIKK